MKTGILAVTGAALFALSAPAFADDDRRSDRSRHYGKQYGDQHYGKERREARRERYQDRRESARDYANGYRAGQQNSRQAYGSPGYARPVFVNPNYGRQVYSQPSYGWNGQYNNGYPVVSGNAYPRGYSQPRYVASNNWVQGRDYWRGNDGRAYCRRGDGSTGVVVGALAGGTLGNVIAPNGNKKLGSVVGGVLGAVLGNEIARGQARCY